MAPLRSSPGELGGDDELPYVDEHSIRIPAARELVWTALQHYVASSLVTAEPSLLRRLLGTEPATGFSVADSIDAERMTLVGRHRFARYLLTFELADVSERSTQVRAQSYAAFPGVRGRVYRMLVIGTRAHVVATNHVLRSVRRLAMDLVAAEQSAI